MIPKTRLSEVGNCLPLWGHLLSAAAMHLLPLRQNFLYNSRTTTRHVVDIHS